MKIRDWSVMLLDTKRNNPNHYITISIFNALSEDTRVSRVTKADYSSAVRLAQSKKYDLLLATDGENINVDVLARLKHLVGLSVLWAWEDPYECETTTRLAPLFDRVFTNDAGSVQLYPAGSHHLPLAASQCLPVRESDSDYSYDVSFVGTAWPNRVLFLRRLLRTLPDLRTRIALSYNPHLPRTYLDLPESSYVGPLSHPDFLDLANRSRVNLTLNRDFSGDGLHPSTLTPGPRLFEIALAGGYQLVDGHGMLAGGYYDAGTQIDTFDDFGACVEAIQQALERPDRRIAMASAAQTRSLAEHTYVHRLNVIFSEIIDRPRPAEKPALPHSVNRAKRRPHVLFVTHNTVAEGHFGGVEVYQETIADKLRSDYEILFYRPAKPAVRNGVRAYVLTSRREVIRTYEMPAFDEQNTMRQPEAEETFARVLTDASIDLVHFHHLINHCASLPLVARMLGVPSVYTLQDFWTVCTRFNLIDHRGLYCSIADRPKTACDVCLKAAAGLEPCAQDYRRIFFSRVLASFDRIIGNSPSATAILRGVYPDLPQDKFVPLGLPVPFPAPRVPAPPREDATASSRPLNVVFLGNFTRVKGADGFLEAAALLRKDNIRLTICGRIDEPYGSILRQEALSHVKVEGGFAPGELDLSRFDISLHLSIWPETYCITLSEAWLAGVVPIVTACGALSDRVTDRQDGYHVPINGSGELVTLLRRLEGSRRELEDVRMRIGGHLWLTPQQHCATLSGVYAKLIADHPQPTRPVVPEVDTGASTNLALGSLALLPPDWTRPDVEWPSLVEPSGAPMAPPVHLLKSVREALHQGRFKSAAALTCHVDAIGDTAHPQPERTGPVTLARSGPPLQIIGWLRHEGTYPATFLVAFRTACGDLILRLVYLHERDDLKSNGTTETRGLGFVTDPLPPQMLDDGVYGVEVLMLRDGGLEIAPIAALLVTPGDITNLVTASRALVLVLLPGHAWSRSPRNPAFRLRGVLDGMQVNPVEHDGTTRSFVLALRGWLIVDNDPVSSGPVALQLLGEKNFHAPLQSVARPDVSRELRLPEFGAHGYEGEICLQDLPAGAYKLELIKLLPRGIAAYSLLPSLQIDADGTASVLGLDGRLKMRERIESPVGAVER